MRRRHRAPPGGRGAELLAPGEVIARKAGYRRRLVVRAGRSAGASGSRTGQAPGTTTQSAWEAHTRWLDQQDRPAGRAARLRPRRRGRNPARPSTPNRQRPVTSADPARRFADTCGVDSAAVRVSENLKVKVIA